MSTSPIFAKGQEIFYLAPEYDSNGSFVRWVIPLRGNPDELNGFPVEAILFGASGVSGNTVECSPRYQLEDCAVEICHTDAFGTYNEAQSELDLRVTFSAVPVMKLPLQV